MIPGPEIPDPSREPGHLASKMTHGVNIRMGLPSARRAQLLAIGHAEQHRQDGRGALQVEPEERR
jgi:hypothetical protein